MPALGIDVDDAACHKFSKKFPTIPTARSLNDSIPTENALYIIAADSEAHSGLLETVLARKPSAVVLEKPVCISVSEYEALKKLNGNLNRRKIPVFVNHERRFHRAYQYVAAELKKHAADDPLREIRSHMTVGGHFEQPPKAGINSNSPLYHDGTHIIDIASFFMKAAGINRPESCSQARISEKWLQVTFEAGGVYHNLSIQTGCNYFAFEMEVRTKKTVYMIGNGYAKKRSAKASKYYSGFRSLHGEVDLTSKIKSFGRRKKLHESPFLNLYRYVLSSLKDAVPAKEVNSSLGDGLNAIRLIHEAYNKSS